jgi:hypothetical protein
VLLRSALRLAEWHLAQDAEGTALRAWLKDEIIARAGQSLAATLLLVTLDEEADLAILRALRTRLLYGDSISLMTVNSMIRLPVTDRENQIATLLVGPLGTLSMVADSEVHCAVRGLDLHEGIHDELHGENWQDNCKLLATAVIRIFNECGGDNLITMKYDANGIWSGFKITSDAAAALILERGEEHLDDIIDIMRVRGTADAELIASILDSDAASISEGEL